MAGTVRIAILANGAKAREELSSVGKAGSKLGSALKTGLAVGAGVAGAAIVKTFVDGVKAAEDYVTLQRKTAAVIKSTGNAAKISVKGVKSLAGSLESMSGIDENLIINAENVLATFTDVRNGVKKSDRVFDQATATIVDMSAALGSDLQGSAIQVGKALNDPIKGISALSRVGVTFTQGQKDQIKALVESGKKMQAQKLILAELNKEFGGAAAAAGGQGFTGALNRAKDAFGDLFRDLTISVLPTLTKVADWFTTKGIPAFGDFAQNVKDKVVPVIDKAFKSLGKIKLKFDLKGALDGILTDVRGWAKPVIDAFTTSLKTGDYGPLGQALGSAVGQAISGASGLASKAFGAIADWAGSVDWVDIGKKVGEKALPFTVGFVNALLDPLMKGEFWSKHWKDVLLFAVNFIPFGKGGSIASRIAGKLGLDKGITGAVIKGLEKSVGKVGGAVLKLFGAIAKALGKGLLKGLGLEEAVAGLGGRIVARFTALGTDVAETGSGIVSGFATRFLGAVEGIGGFIGSAVGKLISFITTPFRMAFGLLKEPITFLFKLWADEFVTGVGKLVGWGRNLVGGLVRGVGSVIRNLLTPIRQGLTLIVQDLAGWGAKWATKGKNAVAALGKAIVDKAKDWGDLLFNAGQNLMQGLLNGIQNFWNNHVKPYLQWITDQISKVKGPPSKDKTLLVAAGELVMQGFLNGLESGYGDVRRSLQGFTSSLPGLGAAGASTSAGLLSSPSFVVAGSGATAATPIAVSFDLAGATSADPVVRELIKAMAARIKVTHGGSVVRALGQPGKA